MQNYLFTFILNWLLNCDWLYKKHIQDIHKVLQDCIENEVEMIQVGNEPTDEIFDTVTNHISQTLGVWIDRLKITMPSSNDNISLGDKVHGKYNTAALHDIMVNTLKLQIRSQMKRDSASEFICRTYFLVTINGPSSYENINLGDGAQGISYHTQVLKQIMINTLSEQIHSRMKIHCCSEFIGRMYFIETIPWERSQKAHADRKFNPATNRDKHCTESS